MTTPITRRDLLAALGTAAGAALAAPRGIRAGAPGRAAVGADGHLQPAAGFRSRRAADDLLQRSRRPDDRSVVQRAGAAERVAHASVDRRAVGRGAGMEQPGTLPGVERHPQQSPAAMARRRRPRGRLPESVQQQQRQHLRSAGAPALLRTPHPPRRPLRARRLGHRDRRRVPGEAAQFAERRRRPSRTAASGSPIRRTADSSTKGRSSRASCRPTCIASIRAAASTWRSRRTRSPIRTA